MATLGASDDTPPGKNLMASIQYCGKKKKPDTYCFSETPILRIDGKQTKYKWQSVIAFNRPYRNLDEMIVPKKWQQAYIGKDPLVGGNMYYKVIKNKKTGRKATLIKYKQLIDGTQLGLTVKFYFPLSRDRAIELTRNRWHRLVTAAEKNGFFTSSTQQRLVLTNLSGDGRELSDGDVIQHVTNFTDPTELRLSIQGGSHTGGQVVFVDLPPSSKKIIDLSADNADLIKTNSGYRVTPKAESIVLNLNFDTIKKYPRLPGASSSGGIPIGPTVGGKIRLCNSRDDCDEVKVEVLDWDIIVPRFIVKTRRAEERRQRGNDIRSVSGGELNYTFNNIVRDDWWYEYIVNHKIVSGWEDSILMGWRLDNAKDGGLHVAESDNRNPGQIAPYLTKTPLSVDFDLEVIQGAALKTPGRDERVTRAYWDKQRRLWRDYYVSYFALTIQKVSTANWSKSGTLGLWDLRGNIDQDWPARMVRKGAYGEHSLFDFDTPKIIRLGGISDETGDSVQPYSLKRLEKPGVYEIRLQMKVRRLDAPESDCTTPEEKAVGQCKDINVAIRIPVVKQRVKYKSLFQKSQRLQKY